MVEPAVAKIPKNPSIFPSRKQLWQRRLWNKEIPEKIFGGGGVARSERTEIEPRSWMQLLAAPVVMSKLLLKQGEFVFD
jgi:hypothetical protein